jgi:hypothetical protein
MQIGVQGFSGSVQTLRRYMQPLRPIEGSTRRHLVVGVGLGIPAPITRDGTTRRHYSMTAFLPADPAQIDDGYEVPEVFRILDFATVQGYEGLC